MFSSGCPVVEMILEKLPLICQINYLLEIMNTVFFSLANDSHDYMN